MHRQHRIMVEETVGMTPGEGTPVGELLSGTSEGMMHACHGQVRTGRTGITVLFRSCLCSTLNWAFFRDKDDEYETTVDDEDLRETDSRMGFLRVWSHSTNE